MPFQVKTLRTKCPHCQNDDNTMIDVVSFNLTTTRFLCNCCSKEWEVDFSKKEKENKE